MTESICFGALAGLATVAISEWLMLCSDVVAMKDFWKLSLTSSALRTVCVIVMLVVALEVGHMDPATFTVSLIVVYLGGILFEARRYRRRIETR